MLRVGCFAAAISLVTRDEVKTLILLVSDVHKGVYSFLRFLNLRGEKGQTVKPQRLGALLLLIVKRLNQVEQPGIFHL